MPSGRSTPQYSAPLESRISPPYTASQMSNLYPLPPSCISGVEDSRSGHVLHSHNGDRFSLTSMVDSGPQTAQLSPIEPYNSGAEQSNEQGPNVLSGMGSWASRRVLGRAKLSNDHHTSDGFTVDPSQIWNSVPIANNTPRPNRGTYLQGIEYQTDPSTLGIDQDLAGPDFSREYGSFAEDANNTKIDAYNSQIEGYPHNTISSGSCYRSNPSALARRNAPSSRNIPPSTVFNLTPPFDHGTHSQIAPGCSNRCHECNMDFANRQNLSRHMHEHHEEQFQYNCLLSKDGLPCTGHVKKRNRKRHVEGFHPRESTELPPVSTHRRPNPQTDEMLDRWFVEVLQSTSL